MHFRTSVEDGLKIGREVGRWVSMNYFRPLRVDGQRVEGDRGDDD